MTIAKGWNYMWGWRFFLKFLKCIFEMFMILIYEKRSLAEVWLIHAEQMPLYSFIILSKKGDSNTGVLLWNL